MLPLALYIHWPFCKSKCPYCDFNSHVRENIDHGGWKQAYLDEMRFYREKTGAREIKSIFFGGGTPSLMEPDTVAAVIDEAHKLWGLPQGAEVTLEANPTSVEAEKLRGFKTAGVNRVSLGVQSLQAEDLKKLGRQHSPDEAIAALKIASSIFDRYSFDLIYARPQQSLADWQAELEEAIAFGAGHMSLYQLTIEQGTPYYTLHQRGELVIPEESLAADMYEYTQERMEKHGMPAYEISNHARFGDESRHNLVYWTYGDYAGIGPGAHGRLTLEGEKWATRAHRAPEIWRQRVAAAGHGAHPFENIDVSRRGWEALMMGLRLADGLSLEILEGEAQAPLSRIVNESRLKILVGEKLVEVTPTRIRATDTGRQKLNSVLSYLAA